MKNNRFIISALTSLALLAAVTSGCQKQAASLVTPMPGTNAVVSVEKTSFAEVTSQLDPGGDFYLYLDTAQWLDGLSNKISAWRGIFTAIPDLQSNGLAQVNKGFDLFTRLVNESGVEDVSGVGLSSVEIVQGIYHNKTVVHHYPDRGTGFMWQLFGGQPHPLTGLDFLPDDTVLAIFSDGNVPLLWSVLQRDVNESDMPRAQQWLQELPAQFERKTGVKWDQFLNSLGGEFGLVLTLDPSNNIPIPLPTAGGLRVPAPGLMLVVKVNDDTIFNRIDMELKKNPAVIAVNKPDLKMRTMSVPLPLPIQLRPSAASSGGYLFIASSDELIEQALAVKSGQEPGLKGTDEFKELSQDMPTEGNSFVYMSRKFGQTMFDLQGQAMTSSLAKQSGQQWMQSLFQSHPTFAYSVNMNTPEGCVGVGNSSRSYATLAFMPAMAVPGMLAAIAIPNFVKARTVSQQNACINNLRMIQAAKQEWALENNKSTNDVPTWDDLKPYVGARVPLVCPTGGTYTINPVGQVPTCSIPGHRLLR